MPKKNNTPAKPALAPEEALFQAVSLCRKAGALTMGFDAVEEACVKGKAWLVMTASDASAKTVQRLNYAVGDLVDVITMPLTQDRLAISMIFDTFKSTATCSKCAVRTLRFSSSSGVRR